MRTSNRPISRQNAARMLARIKRDFDALLIFAPKDAYPTKLYEVWVQEKALKSVEVTLQWYRDIYEQSPNAKERCTHAEPNGNRALGDLSLKGPGTNTNARLFSAGSGGK